MGCMRRKDASLPETVRNHAPSLTEVRLEKKQELPYYLSRITGSQQWFSATVCTALGEEVITMNKTVKTWRIFLLGMCCILACLYLNRIFAYLRLSKVIFYLIVLFYLQ